MKRVIEIIIGAALWFFYYGLTTLMSKYTGVDFAVVGVGVCFGVLSWLVVDSTRKGD